MKTLQEIYENYSHSNNYGDKGTAHSYIETYEKLFEPIRITASNVMEKGGIYVIEDVVTPKMEFEFFHSSFTLYDLSHERGISDNKLIVYKK